MKRRNWLSAILTVVMLISMLTCFVLPAAAATSGTTGDCAWTLDGTVLTISGNGAMRDYTGSSSSQPWGTSITKVVIEDGVTHIGDSAFRGCTGLTSITIPDSVTSIGNYAFAECFGLTSIIIPGNVTTIGEGAFYLCYGLTWLRIRDGVTSIGDFAFDTCSSLTSVTIPDSVTSIGENGFGNCRSLYSVSIGNGVTSIGDTAFIGCGLTSITIPASVTSIGSGAFVACTGLTTIDVNSDNTTYCSVGGVLFNKGKTELIAYPAGKSDALYAIPASVTSIGEYLFDNPNLTSVIIPNSVTSIGDMAFYYCENLTTAYIFCENLDYYGDYVFPRGTTELYELPVDMQYSFSVSYGEATITGYKYEGIATEVVIPGTLTLNGKEYPVTGIDDYAFQNCTGLTSIIIPDGVISIGKKAFYNCIDLTSIIIPDSVISIDDRAFSGCSSLTSIIIPDGVTTINYNLFGGCSSLTSVTIPDSVSSIGQQAFYNCDSLTSVTIPASVTSIGTYAFYDCDGLETAYVLSSSINPGETVFPDTTSLLFLTVSFGKVTIKNYDMGSETKVIIPAEIDGRPVTKIGDEAFSYCGVTSVTIPDSVTSIGKKAFYDCADMTSVTIPASVTSIGNYAFSGCTSLTSVTIPDSVTAIGDSAFYRCTSLTSVTIPASVTSIGNSAFSRCDGLTSVTIPDGVTSIGTYAFYDCDGLTSVTIPNSVTSIGNYAFEYCNGLTSVHITDLAAWCAIDFGNSDSNPLCYAKNLYLNGALIADLVIPDGVTSIGYSAFRGCTSLTSVTIPDSVTSISSYAFYNCKNLTSVIIPNSVTSIGEYAFYYCDNLATAYVLNKSAVIGDYAFPATTTVLYELPVEMQYSISVSDGKVTITKYKGSETEVVIPETITVDGKEYPVTTISSAAFQNNTALTKVTFPETLVQIGSFAFSGCTGLTSLVIPESVTAIGRYAFNGCSGLTSVLFQGANTTLGAYAIPTAATLNYWWSFTIADGEATITGYTGTATELVIPATVVSENVTYPVTQIGSSAFSQNTALTSVVIPEGVVTINTNAFYYCTNLISVKFPTTLKNIYSAAFQGCTNLASVKFPEGLEYIGSVSFNSCRSLTEVTIPQSVTGIGRYAFWVCNKLATATIYNPDIVLGDSAFPTTTTVIYKEGIDTSVPHLTIDPTNTNLAVLNTIDRTVSRVYWGYAGAEEIETQDWNTFASAVPSAIRVSDYNPTEGEVYAMADSGYYLFWIQYTDAEGNAQSTCQTVYAEGTLDENYGKPYLELDETGKVAWMNLNGTTVQKMYWGFIGDTDYKYATWDEFKARIGDTYLPDYGVKDGEGYVVNEVGYYRFVIVYLDAQGIRQERYFTIHSETPATAPSIDNSALSNMGVLVNEEEYSSKVYYGYIGEESTKYIDFDTFKATAESFTTSFGPKPGTSFAMDKAGYWRFVINYTVNGAAKDAVCTVYVDEADLSLGMPKLTQSGETVTLDANGSTVSKVYIGYMGTEAVEIDSWTDYTNNRQTNTVYYGPKDGTAFTLGTAVGYYTVVVSYNTGGADQLAFYTFQI